MRISKETIEGLKTDELVDFIATNRYTPKNNDLIGSADFVSLPVYVKDLIYILDFETEYEMNGLGTLLDNSVGNFIEEIIDSFSRTKNWEIAGILDHMINLKKEDEFDQLNERLMTIIVEKEFWNGVISNIENEIGSQHNAPSKPL